MSDDLRTWFDGLPAEVREELAEFGGYGSGDFLYEVFIVKEMLRGDGFRGDAETAFPPAEGMELSRLADGDGTIDAFQIEVMVKTEIGHGWLGSFLEWRDLTDDRDATGLEAAYAIAEALVSAYAGVCRLRDELTGVKA